MHPTQFNPPSSIQGNPRPRGRTRYCNRLALWSAANLAGMETGLLVIREPFFRRLLNKISRKAAAAMFSPRPASGCRSKAASPSSPTRSSDPTN